jgi:hypothetical protein
VVQLLGGCVVQHHDEVRSRELRWHRCQLPTACAAECRSQLISGGSGEPLMFIGARLALPEGGEPTSVSYPAGIPTVTG